MPDSIHKTEAQASRRTSRRAKRLEDKLTQDLISKYSRLDSRSKELLGGFATVFRDSTIEWISAEKAEQLRREAIPANFEHSLLKSENRKAAERLQRPAAISKTFSKENLYDEHSTN